MIVKMKMRRRKTRKKRKKRVWHSRHPPHPRTRASPRRKHQVKMMMTLMMRP
jgi:hypothetical protein